MAPHLRSVSHPHHGLVWAIAVIAPSQSSTIYDGIGYSSASCRSMTVYTKSLTPSIRDHVFTPPLAKMAAQLSVHHANFRTVRDRCPKAPFIKPANMTNHATKNLHIPPKDYIL